MKAVMIDTKNPQRLVSALVNIRARFVYEYGSIYVLGTSNEEKIKNFLTMNDIITEGMKFFGTEYEF